MGKSKQKFERLLQRKLQAFRKEIEGKKSMENFPYSWTERVNFVKMSTFLKLIYIFNETPVKIPRTFFFDLNNNQEKFLRKAQEIQNS